MQTSTTYLTGSTDFERFVLAKLDDINKRLPRVSTLPIGEYLTPDEVCQILKIGKSKFYQLVRDKYITTIKPQSNGRKTYVLRSQVQKIFPKDFPAI